MLTSTAPPRPLQHARTHARTPFPPHQRIAHKSETGNEPQFLKKKLTADQIELTVVGGKFSLKNLELSVDSLNQLIPATVRVHVVYGVITEIKGEIPVGDLLKGNFKFELTGLRLFVRCVSLE